MTSFHVDRRVGNVLCILRWPDLGAGFRQHDGVTMCTGSARMGTSDFRGRRRLGRDHLRGNRFGRRSRNVLCWMTKICEIESIRLRQSVLHEASVDRRWITDGWLGNRCGYPRRTIRQDLQGKAPRSKLFGSQSNPILQIPGADKEPRLLGRHRTRLANLNFV